ncbi:non-canonical purine NTP pyrophosphatase, partial [bacterium]|nr:non-canonical purine NTP pyrophosphatase [bacterium]
ATEQSGTNGFGYDPVFLVDGYGVTMAEMSEDLKNTISHRANALAKIISFIKSELI